MEWMETIDKAIGYIESHLTEDLKAEDVAASVHISPFYFLKGFSMLCGYSVSEYIRSRRLALAGHDLLCGEEKILEIALKYGYDSPDSFTKAFTRFHGVTPAMARKEEVMLKSFAPLKIKLSLEGGYLMEYKIIKKEAFDVMGASKKFGYENAKSEIPKFWKQHFEAGNGKFVCGTYGINIDENMGGKEFEYLIADLYQPEKEVPQGFVIKTIPAFTWAVFPCKGPMPASMQQVNKKIFSEWLPLCKEYEFAAGYCVELYEDPMKYPKGTEDENYYSEIWIPVKSKA